MQWAEEIAELERRSAWSRAHGGADGVRRQREAGRGLARERIAGLVDEGSFREIGALTGDAEYASGSPRSPSSPGSTDGRSGSWPATRCTTPEP